MYSTENAKNDEASKIRWETVPYFHGRVLDIGCGWGGLALSLNKWFDVEVLGVSLAPDQVRFAQERAAALEDVRQRGLEPPHLADAARRRRDAKGVD